MSFLTRWFQFCSDCFHSWNDYSKAHSSSPTAYDVNITNLAKRCFHISENRDVICHECFLEFFGSDRFIIRHLFSYLNCAEEASYIRLDQLHLFARRIVHWHEFINHSDFLSELFSILLRINHLEESTPADDLFEKNSIDSIFLYELIKDAFFFTAIQSNLPTELSHSSQLFLKNFFHYLYQLNPSENCQLYLKLIKRILPWGFISIHRWLKTRLLSPTSHQLHSFSVVTSSELSVTFLWYLTNWLTSNKAFLHEYDPIVIFEKVSRQEWLTNVYDSDQHGYSIVTLCQCTYRIDGPFLLMFYCNDQNIFALLLEGNLLDSAKSYGGRSSLCLQLSPQFVILERGPSLLYWNIKKRSDGPLGIRIGHRGLTVLSLDLNLDLIHYPQGSSSIKRIQIYKLGIYKSPIASPALLGGKTSLHTEHNLFSVDAHKLAESIGIHLFTQ